MYYSIKPVEEICGLLRCYSALYGSSVPTLQDNLSAPSSRVKKLKMGPYVISQKNADLCNMAVET